MHPTKHNTAGLKRVLVLNADSFVGTRVCRRFFDQAEYLVDGTLYHTPQTYSNSSGNTSESPDVPEEMRTFLYSVMPRHGTISDERFRARVLTYDIIIAILEEDAFEADCTIKVLRGTHYEVEKTFVLVSNVLTWAQTDAYELEQRRAAQRAAREAEREARRIEREENGDDEDDFQEEEEEDEEEEELKLTDWTEDEYRRRQPDIRYSAWRELEHDVKHANSETLHTYVLWSGLPYGDGEDLLAPYFNSAWHHGAMQQYGDGSNYVPTIHVSDLSRIIYLVGSSYDTLDDRYMFAVDQGNNTQAEILQGIHDYIGGTIEVLPLDLDREGQAIEMIRRKEEKEKEKEKGLNKGNLCIEEKPLDFVIRVSYGLANWFSAANLRCEPGAVLGLLEENEWVALGGFFASADRVTREFKAKHMRQPLRIVLSGPPFSRRDAVSAQLAKIFGVPYLTLDNVIEAYQAHVASIRDELSDIILRRRARRRAIREDRIRRAKELEAKRRAAAAAAAAAAENSDEEGEEGSARDDASSKDEGEDEEEGDEEEEHEEEGQKEPAAPSGPETVPEAQLLRGLEDEEHEEHEENEENEEDEPLSRAAAKAAERAAEAAARVDEAERRRIEELRAAYVFSTDLMRLHLENGKFPPKPNNDDEEDEEEDEGDDEEDMARSRRRRQEARRKKAALAALEPPPVIRYLDEALAVMLRWRLRCDDCRSQGYVLDGFPTTVRQARLVFLADTEEQKEKLIPRLKRELEAAAETPQPPDATFPLPILDEMDETQQREMIGAMNGKTFVTAEDALAPAHAAFFPDCFIALTCSRETLQAEAAAAKMDETATREFFEQLTHYETHTRVAGLPTESLLTWFQTITTERDVGYEDNDRRTTAEGTDDGPQGEKPPRMATVLVVPSPVSVNATSVDAEASKSSSFDKFCEMIRWRVKSSLGENFLGPTVIAQRDEEDAEFHRLNELEREAEEIKRLEEVNDAMSTASHDALEQNIEEERRALRYYQAKEEREGVANIEAMPGNEYLMKFVLPSLTPLMAEIVRQRPSDPVTALADRLFHHKRKTVIGE